MISQTRIMAFVYSGEVMMRLPCSRDISARLLVAGSNGNSCLESTWMQNLIDQVQNGRYKDKCRSESRTLAI